MTGKALILVIAACICCNAYAAPGGPRPASYHEPPDNQRPMADFTVECTELACRFTDQSSDDDGSVVSWHWDFGDETESGEQNPEHSYAGPGNYPVRLTVTDNGGATGSRSVTVTVTAPSDSFVINAAMADAWFDPLTDGQGFFVIVWESSGLLFLSWFTYDTARPAPGAPATLGEPGHRWLTAQGPYAGDSATLDLYLSAGGVFDAAEPAPGPAQSIGTATLTWTSCSAGTLTYTIPALGLSGTVAIERIVQSRLAACQAAQSP